MELITRIKHAVGIGTPTLAIAGVAGPVRAGDVLRGTVVLVGGDDEVAVDRVVLHFDEQHLSHTRPTGAAPPERFSRRRVASVEIDLQPRRLASNERIEREFTLPLPSALEPSAGPRAYALLAEVPIAGLDPRAEVPLEVVA